MISKIIQFSLKQRLFIIITTVIVAILGVLAFQNLPIDVFPDPSPPLVQVYTEGHGMAPEEIERLISYPIESAMFGLPKVKNIRSVSTFALSIVNVYFEDGTDIYWARQLVAQRLLEAKETLPEQVHNAELGPIATGLGLVYLYYLEGEGQSLLELRTLQDWLVKYELKSVPEVSQVLSIGGDVKQYQILTNPQLLLKYNLSISELIERVRKNNQNIGAGFITRGKEEYIVRSVGLVQNIQDLENIVVANYEGTPVFLKNVAEVQILPAIKRGSALVNGEGEKVVGMVLKLFGSNTAKVITDIEQRIEGINKSLPEGVRIVPFYNQASLVKSTFSTVSTNLILGIILVVLVLFLFMGNIPSALIAVLSLPFSILFSFILMQRINLAADLISFGGFAIAIGLIADAAIILVENTHRHLQIPHESKVKAIITAGEEVGRPLFFAIVIIILVFLPVFTLTGTEGIMFRPMGFTIAFALIGSLIFALISIPPLAFYLLRKKGVPKQEPFLIRHIKKLYIPFFQTCQKHRKRVFLVTFVVFAIGLALVPFMGREYIPYLEEGTLHLRATFDPNISLTETIALTSAIEKNLMDIPEITGILSRIGRGEVGSHAHLINDAEILIQIQPIQKWKRFKHKDELIEEIEHRLENFPGLTLNMTQPIAHNLDELITGVKAQLAVKLYGEDFEILKDKATQIKDQLAMVEGASDVQVEQFTGQNHIQIVLNRPQVARYGINIQDIQETIEAAVGGITLGQVYEEQKRFDIFLRFEPEFRQSIEHIENLLIPLPNGGQIPLKQLGAAEEVVGARAINRERNKRFITIQANIRGRDIGRFVVEAQKKIEETVTLPPEYSLFWGGQFELQQRANKRLGLIMPITLVLVALLLFTIFYSFQEVLIILINIPLALTGGIIALKISGLYLSVPASIGFIAIFGIALEDGLVLISAFHRKLKDGLPMKEAILDGVQTKLRPVLMTSFTTIFGVLPLLLAQGPGAEIQRPLATVVVGGLTTSTLVTLIVLPLIFQSLKKEKIEE
ncbi:MAG: CusA/CzcA family heavy metal efflux RND transporter [Candidatus Aminicenantes bacterium]|nr:CusA/CzcA family heavy metal efflux RND transporter [Candidatus Aminicenantes bacterium]